MAGFDLTSLTPKERTIYRRSIVGFVWQQTTRNLLPYLNAEENVELPLILEGLRGADRREYAVELLRLVGMGERAGHRPDQLSGGEQQRVADRDRAREPAARPVRGRADGRARHRDGGGDLRHPAQRRTASSA